MEPHTLSAEAQVLMFLLVLLVLLVSALGALVLAAAYFWDNTISVTQVEVNEGVWFVELPYKLTSFLPTKSRVQLSDDVTVEWSRCAPEPMNVHVYHTTSTHLIKQDTMYRGRTNMKKEPLKTGDLSLTLRDPCYRDSGTYTCTVYKDREILAQKVVWLQVKAISEDVTGGDWAETFTLPFITTAHLPEDATVEWRRDFPKAMTVHVYQKGQDQPGKQDEYYHGHTKMNSDPLRSKDLSVTVCNSGHRDFGRYICTVHRDGVILAKKVVMYCIQDSRVNVEVFSWAMPAKLPWQITANLPEDATVEWKRADVDTLIGYTKVHVYQDGQDQPDKQAELYRGRTMMKKNPLQTGDLSLTLNNPTVRDSGSYSCSVTVNGELVWTRSVQLQVKGGYF